LTKKMREFAASLVARATSFTRPLEKNITLRQNEQAAQALAASMSPMSPTYLCMSPCRRLPDYDQAVPGMDLHLWFTLLTLVMFKA
jgi:hypothetical protein